MMNNHTHKSPRQVAGGFVCPFTHRQIRNFTGLKPTFHNNIISRLAGGRNGVFTPWILKSYSPILVGLLQLLFCSGATGPIRANQNPLCGSLRSFLPRRSMAKAGCGVNASNADSDRRIFQLNTVVSG
jgi:hypothetical protein